MARLAAESLRTSGRSAVVAWITEPAMDQLSRALAAWTPRRVMLGTLVVVGVLSIAYLMIEFYSVLVIMFIAFVLSTAIRPLVNLFQRFKIPPNLGVILADRDLAEAITWCRRAHELSPGEGKYAHSLAFYLRQSGDIDGSIAVLRRAIERNPLDVDSTMLLGQTLAGRGDPKGAAGVIRALLDRDGLPGPLQDQLVALIRQLESMPAPADRGDEAP